MTIVLVMAMTLAPWHGEPPVLVGSGCQESLDATSDRSLPADWEIVSGHWAMRDGVLSGRPDARSGEGFVLMAARPGDDVALEAEIVFERVDDPSRWVALVVRAAADDRPGVQFTVRQDASRGNGLEIARLRMPERRWQVLGTSSSRAPLIPGERHRLRVEASGRWVTAWLDGVEVLSSARGNEIAGGSRAGFRLHGADVRVEGIRFEAARGTDRPRTPVTALPLVIAHRGFSSRAPENTLAAYRAAIEVGAEMAECDVWLTADRVPVLLHDESLERTTGLVARVGDLTLAQIRRLDAGSWKGAAFAGEPVPTLRETLETVRGKLRLIIEIKQPGMEKEVLEAIGQAGIDPDDVMIFAFDREVVSRMVAQGSRGEGGPPPVTWLVGDMPHDPAGRRAVLRQALQAHASAIGLPLERVDPAVLREARARGLSVYVWTVDEADDMRHLIEIGADGIITDRPDLLLDLLGRR